MLKVRVQVYASVSAFQNNEEPFRDYVIDHDVVTSRRVLGEQCRNAFEAGQVIVTFPLKKK